MKDGSSLPNSPRASACMGWSRVRAHSPPPFPSKANKAPLLLLVLILDVVLQDHSPQRTSIALLHLPVGEALVLHHVRLPAKHARTHDDGHGAQDQPRHHEHVTVHEGPALEPE